MSSCRPNYPFIQTYNASYLDKVIYKLKNVMLIYYEMTTVTMMVMRRKRLKTSKNMNLQNMQLLSQMWNQNITVKKYGCMYEQF